MGAITVLTLLTRLCIDIIIFRRESMPRKSMVSLSLRTSFIVITIIIRRYTLHELVSPEGIWSKNNSFHVHLLLFSTFSWVKYILRILCEDVLSALEAVILLEIPFSFKMMMRRRRPSLTPDFKLCKRKTLSSSTRVALFQNNFNVQNHFVIKTERWDCIIFIFFAGLFQRQTLLSSLIEVTTKCSFQESRVFEYLLSCLESIKQIPFVGGLQTGLHKDYRRRKVYHVQQISNKLLCLFESRIFAKKGLEGEITPICCQARSWHHCFSCFPSSN